MPFEVPMMLTVDSSIYSSQLSYADHNQSQKDINQTVPMQATSVNLYLWIS